MKQKQFNIVYWSVLLAIIGGMLLQLILEDFDLVRPIDGDGTYVFHSEELIPREEVDILIVADGKIHLFYIENELVNVYTTSGEFLYGFQFPNYYNGRSDMTYRDGRLYVDARVVGIYVFDGADMIRFEDLSMYNGGYDELVKLFNGKYPNTDGEYTYEYVSKTNKIIRNGNGVTEDVLQFPQRGPFYHRNLLALTVMIAIATCYGNLNKMLAKRKKKQ